MIIVKIGTCDYVQHPDQSQIPEGWAQAPELVFDEDGLLDMVVSEDPPYLLRKTDALLFSEAKESAHEQRRQLRNTAELGGFTHDSHRFDSDRDSILRITNASQAAMQSIMVGLPFSTVWTCFDGYQYPVPDAATMLQIHGALVAHGQACHTYSQALAVQIEAADTLEALQAIDITAGWPG